MPVHAVPNLAYAGAQGQYQAISDGSGNNIVLLQSPQSQTAIAHSSNSE